MSDQVSRPQSSQAIERGKATRSSTHSDIHRGIHGDTRWVYLGLALMSLLGLLPIWLFDTFPSQDGPVHINSVSVLNDYSNNDLYQRFYTEQWQLTANQAFFALYAGLGKLLPLAVVQKLLLSFYILTTPLALVLSLRILGGAPYAALLIVPVLYSLVLYMGFFSFCLSLGLFTFTLTSYFYFARRPSWRRALGLTLILYGLYFSHPLAALGAMTVIAVYAIADSLRSRSWHRAFTVLACLAPTALTILGFWLAKSIRLARFTDGVATASSSSEILLEFVKSVVSNPYGPIQKVTYLLGSLALIPSWLSALYYLLLGVLSFLAVRSWQRTRSNSSASSYQNSALIGALTMVLALILAPERLDEFGWLPARLLPLVIITLALGLGSAPLPRRVWRAASVIALVLGSSSLLWRLPEHARLAQTLSDYRSVSAVLEPNSVVLPIHFDVLYTQDESDASKYKPEFLPLHHAAGYLLLDKPLINLRNYQASKTYFPLRHRSSHDPMTQFSPDAAPSSFHGAPLHLDLRGFEVSTGESLDYVLVWGTPKNPALPDVVDFFGQLAAGYKLIDTVESSETMRVYERVE